MSANIPLQVKNLAARSLCNAIKNRGVLKDDVSLSPTVRGNSIIVTFTDKNGIIIGSRTWSFPASIDPDDLVRDAETMTSVPYLKNSKFYPEQALKPGLLEDGN